MSKRFMGLISAMILLLNTMVVVYADDNVWNGESDISWFTDEEDSYTISTAEELAGWAELVNGGEQFRNTTINLESDIILNSGTIEKNDNEYSFLSEQNLLEWTPIGIYAASNSRGFRGTFNGNGHKISGIYINSDEGHVGLFGISYGCTINDLTIDNSLIITRKNSAGGLIAGVPEGVGGSVTVSVNNCSVDAIITDNGEATDSVYLGGIIGSGYASNSKRNIVYNVSKSHFDGTVTAAGTDVESVAAGIIARGGKADKIQYSYNAGNIFAGSNAAGICAVPQAGSVISESYNIADVSATEYAGGITGNSAVANTVKNSYNSGMITGGEGCIGGISAGVSSVENYANNYYLETSAACAYTTDEACVSQEGVAEAVTEEDLKGTVLSSLNSENEVFALPLNDDNNGYPVIKSIYYEELFGGKYELSNLYISGETGLGDELTAEFTLTGEETVADYIRFQWFVSEPDMNDYTPIDDATGRTLTITRELHNKDIIFELYQPVGDALQSEKKYVNIFDTSFTGTIEDLEVRGIFTAGNTLYYRYNSDDVDESKIFEVQWLEATSKDGIYTAVGSDVTFQTKRATVDYYYKVKVTLINGVEYESAPIKMEKEIRNIHTTFTGNENVQEKTPSENVFAIDGYEFIVLDTVSTSDSGRFLVLAKDSASKYGSGQLSMPGTLSDELLAKLPTSVAEYVEKTAFWLNGKKMDGETWNRSGLGSVYIPSIEVIKKYADKIGLADESAIWWTASHDAATAAERKDGQMTFAIDTENIGETVARHTGNNPSAYRPIFYLGYDFFKNVKLDTEKIGENVFKVIRQNYDKKELLNLYTETELAEVFGFENDIEITSSEVIGDKNSTAFSVKLGFKSNIDGAIIKVLAAIYDDNGRLVDLMYADKTLDKSETDNVQLDFSEMDEGVKTVKATVLGGDSSFEVFDDMIIVE